jgi:hypothetical protein
VAALKELIDKKMKGRKIVAPPEDHEPRTRVTDLMSALKKSIGQVPEKPRVKAHGTPAQGARFRPQGRSEALARQGAASRAYWEGLRELWRALRID